MLDPSSQEPLATHNKTQGTLTEGRTLVFLPLCPLQHLCGGLNKSSPWAWVFEQLVAR